MEPQEYREDEYRVSDNQLDLGGSFDLAAPAAGGGAPVPDRTGRVSVCDLKAGTTVEGVYLLAAKETRNTKAGKPFFKLKVSDRTGTVDCTVWEIQAMDAALQTGDLVAVSARVTDYQGKPQLEATRVAAAPAGLSGGPRLPALHLPRCRRTEGLFAVPHRLGARPGLRGSAPGYLRRSRAVPCSSPPLRRPSCTTTPISAA